MTGALVGRAKLKGQGASVHKTFSNADGEVTLVAPGGEIRKAFAELMGTNIVKGLGLLSKKDTTPIRCGVAHFQARNGVLSASQIVFDTGPTLVSGKGTINMDTERLDFRLQGHPKKLQLIRLALPVTVGGTLLRPKIGVEAGKAIGQGGVAVALATLLTPLAVILPFVDSGLAKNANCAALIADGAAEGAPVKTARLRSPKAR
jgi:uncharacterized protein involved in outer membrane biogenesis